MTSKFLSIVSAVAAAAVMTSPLAQASVVSDFKADLKSITEKKSNTAASKAAAKLVSQYVDAKKGDPKKYFTFTKLAQNGIKKVTDDKSKGKWAEFWSQFTVATYFKKGIKKTFDPNDKQYLKSFNYVYGKLPNSQKSESVVNKAFAKLESSAKKAGASSASISIMQQQTQQETGIFPPS